MFDLFTKKRGNYKDDTLSGLTVALALVPDLARRDVQGMPSEEYVLQKPNSAFSEAIQRVRTSLFLGNPAHAPKTVLVTSSVPLWMFSPKSRKATARVSNQNFAV